MNLARADSQALFELAQLTDRCALLQIDSTVSAANLYLIALLAPAVIILAVSIGWERSVWNWNVGWLGL